MWSAQEYASQVSKGIHDDTLEERLQIQFFGDMRRASVKLDGKVLAAKVNGTGGGGAGVCEEGLVCVRRGWWGEGLVCVRRGWCGEGLVCVWGSVTSHT